MVEKLNTEGQDQDVYQPLGLDNGEKDSLLIPVFDCESACLVLSVISVTTYIEGSVFESLNGLS